MSSKNIPRLFIDKELKLNAKIELNHNDKHYLKNVLRLYNGDFVKIFRDVTEGLDGCKLKICIVVSFQLVRIVFFIIMSNCHRSF